MNTKITRRERLHEAVKEFKPTSTTNVGLWLDKYIEDSTHQDKESRAKFARQIAEIGLPDEYNSFFKAWERSLIQIGADCRQVGVGDSCVGCDRRGGGEGRERQF